MSPQLATLKSRVKAGIPSWQPVGASHTASPVSQCRSLHKVSQEEGFLTRAAVVPGRRPQPLEMWVKLKFMLGGSCPVLKSFEGCSPMVQGGLCSCSYPAISFFVLLAIVSARTAGISSGLVLMSISYAILKLDVTITHACVCTHVCVHACMHVGACVRTYACVAVMFLCTV